MLVVFLRRGGRWDTLQWVCQLAALPKAPEVPLERTALHDISVAKLGKQLIMGQ